MKKAIIIEEPANYVSFVFPETQQGSEQYREAYYIDLEDAKNL